MTLLRITFASWPLPRQTYTHGLPPGYGARLAVTRYAGVLDRLAGGDA